MKDYKSSLILALLFAIASHETGRGFAGLLLGVAAVLWSVIALVEICRR